MASDHIFLRKYTFLESQLPLLLVYIQEQNNAELTAEFKQKAAAVLRKTLEKGLFYKSIFKESLTEFAKISTKGEDWIK